MNIYTSYSFQDITVDQFIDVIEDNRSYIPVLYVFNKIDSLTIEELDILDQMPNYVPISSFHNWNLEELMDEIWSRCNMIRIYTKPRGQIPDYEEPYVFVLSALSTYVLTSQKLNNFIFIIGSSCTLLSLRLKNSATGYIEELFLSSLMQWFGGVAPNSSRKDAAKTMY
jgi:hypothetical protein